VEFDDAHRNRRRVNRLHGHRVKTQAKTPCEATTQPRTISRIANQTGTLQRLDRTKDCV